VATRIFQNEFVISVYLFTGENVNGYALSLSCIEELPKTNAGE